MSYRPNPQWFEFCCEMQTLEKLTGISQFEMAKDAGFKDIYSWLKSEYAKRG